MILNHYLATIPKTVLSNLRISSPALEGKMYLELGKSRMDFVGEAAFSLLVRNLYLDSADLRNCTRSKSDELEEFAALCWCYLENAKFTTIRVTGTKQITTLSETIKTKKRMTKVWEPFMGKVLIFDCRHLRMRQDDYWRGAKEFLNNYEKYISTIEVYATSKNGNLDLVDDKRLQLFPNLQYLHLWPHCNGKLNKLAYFDLALEIEAKKCESPISLNSKSCVNEYKFFDSISEIVTVTDLDLQLESKKIRNTYQFKNVKEFILFATMKTGEFEEATDLEGSVDLGKVQSIYLNSTRSLSQTFELLLPFSSISSVTLDHMSETKCSNRTPMYYQISQYFQFSTVKSYFYVIDETMTKYLSAGAIFHIFSNLKYLNIIAAALRKYEFTKCLKSEIISPTTAPHTDMFQLYGNGGSLKDSNIWNICKGLRVLTFKTQTTGKFQYSTRMFETHTRNADGLVVFEKIF